MPGNFDENRNASLPVRRPLLAAAFCYFAGIAAVAHIGCLGFPAVFLSALLAICGAAICHAAGVYFPGSRRLALAEDIFLFSGVFLCGWLAADLRINNPSGMHLSALMDKPREGVGLIVTVADDPAERARRGKGSAYWSFEARARAISRTGHFQDARGEVLAMLPGDDVRPRYGETWKLSGVLADLSRLANPPSGKRAGAPGANRFVFYADRRQAPEKLEEVSRWSAVGLCFELREKCARILSLGIGHRPDVVAILRALVLGRQHDLPPDMREAFVATGTFHVFAVSGQHVAIIALFLIFMLQFYGVCRLNWFYYLAPALLAFTIMTGMSASAVRGCLMALMCFAGTLLSRRMDVAAAMAMAALIITGADPLQLFQPGFLLSFGVVAGLVVLCPPLVEAGERLLAPDPFRLRPEERPARGVVKALRWLMFIAIASLAAWLVSTPLIARWFNLVSPVALVANLFVIPLTTLVLLAGCLSIACGWLCPFAAEVFNHANILLVSLAAGIAQLLAKVPLGHFYVRAPPLWIVFAWLGFLVFWRIYFRQARVWLAALLVLCLAVAAAWQGGRKAWEVHVLNVDGCAVCFVSSGRQDAMANAGPEYMAQKLLRHLRKNGVNRLQALVCPFPDAGHAGAAGSLLEAMPVAEIHSGPGKTRTSSILAAAAARKNIVYKALGPGHGPASPVFESGDLRLYAGTNSAAPARLEAAWDGAGNRCLIEVAEETGAGVSGSWPAPPRGTFRIICRPASESADLLPGAASISVMDGGEFYPGPGQGIILSPGRGGVEVRAAALR